MFLIAPKQLPYEFPFYGSVEKIFMTYGFVSTADGNRFFFHFGTCATKPELLKVGDPVEFYLGEDPKTHRLHAQRVRRIKKDAAGPTPSAKATAILNKLPPAAVFVSAQALLTVSNAANLLSMPYQAAARVALSNTVNTPSSSSVSPPAMISMPMVSAVAPVKQVDPQPMVPNMDHEIKRAPLRQIAGLQQQNMENLANRGAVKSHGSGAGDWNAVLFKPFPGGPSVSDRKDADGVNLSAFERARNAWYSVSDY